MLILGIDPGSQVTGYGVIDGDAMGRVKYVAHGVVRVPQNLSFAQRLNFIHAKLDQILDQYKPELAAIESIFLGRNADSAFKLGHARGVCLQILASREISVMEYPTRLVKKGITGTGAASKEQVQAFVRALLGLQQLVELDASDALAVAIYKARQMESEKILARVREGIL